MLENERTIYDMASSIVGEIFIICKDISEHIFQEPGSVEKNISFYDAFHNAHAAFVTSRETGQNVIPSITSIANATRSLMELAKQKKLYSDEEKFFKLNELVSDLEKLANLNFSTSTSETVSRDLFTRIRRIQEQVDRYQMQMANTASRLEMISRQADSAQSLTDSIESLIDEKIKQAVKPASDASQSVSAEYKKTIESLESSKEKVANLVDAVTNGALSQKHLEDAVAQKAIADFYRKFTLAAMAITTAFSLWILLQLAGEKDPSPLFWITRITILIVITIPSAFLARESSKHREREILNRTIGLNLLALNPYLQDMDTPQKNSLKADLAKTLFSTKQSRNSKNSYEFNSIGFLESLTRYFDKKN